MTLFAWVVLGLVSGIVASKIINKSGKGFLFDVVLAIAGAVVGGWFFNKFGMAGVSESNLQSFCVAIIGALGALLAYHVAVRGIR